MRNHYYIVCEICYTVRVTTVLYFQAPGKTPARQKLEGIYAYGREHDWNVQIIESCASERKAAELVEFWAPDGVIVECGSATNHFDIRLFGKTPVVFLDRNPKTLTTPACCVTHDSVATAKVAARELLSLKLTAYAYVPWPEPRFWSEDREKGFSEALRLAIQAGVNPTPASAASWIRVSTTRTLRIVPEPMPRRMPKQQLQMSQSRISMFSQKFVSA